MAERGQGEQNKEIAYLILAGMAALLIWLLWSRIDIYVIEGLLWVRWAQVWVLAQLPWLGERFAPAASELHTALTDYAMGGKGPTLVDASRYIGGLLRWIAVPLLLAGVWWMTRRNVVTQYRRRLSLDAFARFQARAWRMILPAVLKNPLKSKDDSWAEALSPEGWVQHHGIEMVDIAPDRETVRDLLSKQLTRPWDGIDQLKPHERGLVALMALKHAQKTEETTKLAGMLSDGWTRHGSIRKAFKNKPGLKARVDKILKDPELGGKIIKHGHNHAFIETAMANMLDQARKRGGVLASAEFLWLKPEDRNLWYVLNNVGRPTNHIEAAGATAHWKAEYAAGRPLPEPDVDEAVFGLEEYLARVAKFKPDKTVA